jgi:hypothetical protein
MDMNGPKLEEHFDMWARDEASKMKHKSPREGEDFIRQRFRPLRMEESSFIIVDAETREEHAIAIIEVKDITPQ